MTRSGQTVQLSASIPKELMDEIEDLAIQEKRSRSNLVSLLLEQAITAIKSIEEI